MAFIWHFSTQPPIRIPMAAAAEVNRGDGVAVNAGGYAQKIASGSTQSFAGFAVDNFSNAGGANGDSYLYVHPEGIVEAEVLSASQASLFQTVFLFDATNFTLTATDTTPCGVITEYMGGFTVRIAIQTAFHKQIG